MRQSIIQPKFNTALTKKVIALHNQGYVFDYSVTADYRILCIQDSRLFTIDQVNISMIDLRFDQITSSYKYIHLVETCCGDKGLLIGGAICVNALLAAKCRPAALSGKQTETGNTLFTTGNQNLN